MSTPWLFESALVGLVLALQYSTLKERMPDATATLVEAASIFFLVMTTNVLIRQSLLVLLLSICTATYLKTQPIVGPKMEENKYGCGPRLRLP